jgi:hypothetical protein
MLHYAPKGNAAGKGAKQNQAPAHKKRPAAFPACTQGKLSALEIKELKRALAAFIVGG